MDVELTTSNEETVTSCEIDSSTELVDHHHELVEFNDGQEIKYAYVVHLNQSENGTSIEGQENEVYIETTGEEGEIEEEVEDCSAEEGEIGVDSIKDEDQDNPEQSSSAEVPNSVGETINLYYANNVATTNSSQISNTICLDDEQASAIANLLAFHNQQPQNNNNNNANHQPLETLEVNTTKPMTTFSIYGKPYIKQEKLSNEDLIVNQPSSTSLHFSEKLLPRAKHYSLLNSQILKKDFQNSQPIHIEEKSKSDKPTVKTYQRTKSKESQAISTKGQSDYIITSSRNSTYSEYKIPSSIPATVQKRKRRLIVDGLKCIPNAEFKEQLQNTSDIVGKPELAPTTKKAMYYLAYGGVGKFFAYPGRKIQSVPLAKLFFSRLTMTSTEPRVTTVPNAKLEVLDPELKTPLNSTASINTISHGAVNTIHFFNETIAKRTAISFDHLIKGMNVSRSKTQVYRKKRKPKYGFPINSLEKTVIQNPSVEFICNSLEEEGGEEEVGGGGGGEEEVETETHIQHDENDILLEEREIGENMGEEEIIDTRAICPDPSSNVILCQASSGGFVYVDESGTQYAVSSVSSEDGVYYLPMTQND